MATDEIWKLIEGTDDYFISSRGRLKRGKKLRKISIDPEGYARCHINGKKMRVHRLVASAFIPNPNNLPVVDHLDGNKTNNYVENLRWCTQQENTQAAYDAGLISRSSSKYIMIIDSNDNCTLVDNQVKASNETGVSTAGITKIVRGIEKQRSGYKFFRCNEFNDHREK